MLAFALPRRVCTVFKSTPFFALTAARFTASTSDRFSFFGQLCDLLGDNGHT